MGYFPVPEPREDEYKEFAWGLHGKFPNKKFEPMVIPRAKVGPKDVKMDLLYSGVCHSDVHLGADDLSLSMFPMVPGHELLGTVSEVGSEVTNFKVGDKIGVGVIVDSCQNCENCEAGEEQYCLGGFMGNVHTYNDKKRYNLLGGNPDTQTFGGYSGSHVCNEKFVVKIPDGLDMERAAPILCAGITMYDPLAHWGALNGGKTVGIVGIGGLGTMGVKMAKAMGNKVVAISTTASKEAMCKEKGADVFVCTSNDESVKAAADTCDLILNTISVKHDAKKYMSLLRKNGTLVQIGLVPEDQPINCVECILKRTAITGSWIGGIKATQDCLDFCAKHNIHPDT